LPSGNGREAKATALKAGDRADLTAWRRAARARAYPAASSGVPHVPSGSLVIVGGGGLPDEVVKKFTELAGGPDALIVVLPTATEVAGGNPDAGFLRRGGAREVVILPARDRHTIESDEYRAILRRAKGIWFGGGRQWRFVDAYEDTNALGLFRDVLRRGGVIGGTSAGATIQGEFLCRGSPLNNSDMICEGYERGFAFLPGVAIDQHFSQRKRQRDLAELIRTHPEYLGIGIDEATALVVSGHRAEVLGRHSVSFLDGRNGAVSEYQVVGPGGSYDLKTRTIVEKGQDPAGRK
jgi:cyanophycinase